MKQHTTFKKGDLVALTDPLTDYGIVLIKETNVVNNDEKDAVYRFKNTFYSLKDGTEGWHYCSYFEMYGNKISK